MDVLELIELREQVTFADVDRRVIDKSISGPTPEHFLYETTERNRLLWVFYTPGIMNVLKELLQREVLDVIETSTISYARDLTPSTTRKFKFLLNCDNWIPTVLIKGPNFYTEWEQQENDTE